ncbi:MAG: hypothetical protein HUU54_05705 [Ignavibacteriaceae bacterium]|nr:hypothetical protein [Ignavibacteriaceae bacterium]
MSIQKYKDNVLNDVAVAKYSKARILIINNYYECIIEDGRKTLRWNIPPYPEVWLKIMNKRHGNSSVLVLSSENLYELSLERLCSPRFSPELLVMDIDNISRAIIPLLHDYRNILLEEPFCVITLKKIINLLEVNVAHLEESFFYNISSSIDTQWIRRFKEIYNTENYI